MTAASPTRAGLHASPGHDGCTACHARGHDPGTRADRAACATCHATVKGAPIAQHEPRAKRCIGCHPFGDGR